MTIKKSNPFEFSVKYLVSELAKRALTTVEAWQSAFMQLNDIDDNDTEELLSKMEDLVQLFYGKVKFKATYDHRMDFRIKDTKRYILNTLRIVLSEENGWQTKAIYANNIRKQLKVLLSSDLKVCDLSRYADDYNSII